MSSYMIEKVLWEICNDPQRTPEFNKDPGLYLTRYRLNDEERRMLIQMDVRALAEDNVNPLLIMMAYQQIKGPQAMPEYLAAMNARG